MFSPLLKRKIPGTGSVGNEMAASAVRRVLSGIAAAKSADSPWGFSGCETRRIPATHFFSPSGRDTSAREGNSQGRACHAVVSQRRPGAGMAVIPARGRRRNAVRGVTGTPAPVNSSSSPGAGGEECQGRWHFHRRDTTKPKRGLRHECASAHRVFGISDRAVRPIPLN